MILPNIKNAEDCRHDLIALGEIMLRLDPGEGRVRTARQFNAWEGGGEYNVARGLRRCFGLKTSVVTAFADKNECLPQAAEPEVKNYLKNVLNQLGLHVVGF